MTSTRSSATATSPDATGSSGASRPVMTDREDESGCGVPSTP